MAKYVLFFLIFAQFHLAQNKRFIYEYKSIKDSTKQADVSTEEFYLDTNNSGSVFYSYYSFKKDSISTEQGYRAANLSDKVLKTYPDFITSLFKMIDTDMFQSPDDRKLDWQILPETIQIETWKAQKATTNFAGRRWIAWFSTEIPINDGPYKFRGLPGLIIKIEDESRSHIYMLKSIININSKDINILQYGSKAIRVSREDFAKAFKSYRKDPMKSWVQKGIVMSETDLTPDIEFLNNMAKHKKSSILRDNNILEIDLLQ